MVPRTKRLVIGVVLIVLVVAGYHLYPLLRNPEFRASRTGYEVVELHLDWLWDPAMEEPEEWQITQNPTCLIGGPEDHLLLSDVRSARITRFTTEGQPVEIIGSRGSGPGEFQFPEIIVFNEDTSTLWTTDRNLGRISRFLLSTNDSEFIDSFPSIVASYLSVPSLIPGSPDDFWTVGFGNEMRIRHLTRDGNVLHEFGEPWVVEGLQRMLADLLNRGLLLQGDLDHLIYVWRTRPIIELWTKDGELLLEQTLEYPEIAEIAKYEEDYDPSELGTEFVPFYTWGACSIPTEERFFISFNTGLGEEFVVYELSTIDFSTRQKYILRDPPEFFSPATLVAIGHGRSCRFYILDRHESGIAVLEPAS